jgi:hypothetical protein
VIAGSLSPGDMFAMSRTEFEISKRGLKSPERQMMKQK